MASAKGQFDDDINEIVFSAVVKSNNSHRIPSLYSECFQI